MKIFTKKLGFRREIQILKGFILLCMFLYGLSHQKICSSKMTTSLPNPSLALSSSTFVYALLLPYFTVPDKLLDTFIFYIFVLQFHDMKSNKAQINPQNTTTYITWFPLVQLFSPLDMS